MPSTNSRSRFIGTGILAIGLSGIVLANFGFDMDKKAMPGKRPVQYNSSTEIRGDHPKTKALQDALKLLADAVAHCSPSGGSSTDVVNRLAGMAEDGRIDEEQDPGRLGGDLADTHTAAWTSTMGRWAAENTDGVTGVPTYHGEGFTGTTLGPGTNLNPDAIPTNPTPGSTANLASILFHEGVHADEGHGKSGPVTADDEREAYEREAAMLCCMVDYLNAEEPEGYEEQVAALCARSWSIFLIYVCRLEGNAADLDLCCGIPPWIGWICGTPVAGPPPQNIIPRPPIDPGEMNVARVLHRTQLGLFTGDLIPASKTLLVTLTGSTSGSWPIDLSNQTEGTFQPLAMIEGAPGQIYMSGRIQETSMAAIYRFTFSWSGVEPVLTPNLIYTGTDMGDITAIAYTYDLNGCLAVLDFTNGQLNYVNVADGGVTTLVEYDGNHPEMLFARGMIASYLPEDPVNNLDPGIHFTIQREQTVRLLEPVTFSLNVVDVNFDGALDDYYLDQ